MKRATATLVCLMLLTMLLACSGGGKKPEAGDGDGPKAGATHKFKFGEQHQTGDLIITVREATSQPFAGQHHGRFTNVNLTVAMIEVKNTSAGKIASWQGWQGRATVEDEHGNRFAPIDLDGWSGLPFNGTPGATWGGDVGAKIAPGQTYVNALYHEPAPATSKRLTVSVPLGGETLAFSGRVGWKKTLDRE